MNDVALVGRLVPIRLADIPIATRRRYGARLIRDAKLDGHNELALLLKLAVERPSSTPYFVPASEAARVLGPRTASP